MKDKAQLARWIFRIGLVLVTAGLLGYLAAWAFQPEKTAIQIFLTYLPSFGSGIVFGVFLGTAGRILAGYYEAQIRLGTDMTKAWTTGDADG